MTMTSRMGRSLDHAELVIEGILHRLKLAGIATEGENQTLGRVCLSLIHLWVEITGQGRSVGNGICFLSFCSVLSKGSDAFVRPCAFSVYCTSNGIISQKHLFLNAVS